MRAAITAAGKTDDLGADLINSIKSEPPRRELGGSFFLGQVFFGYVFLATSMALDAAR
jgi:hypothetical protein